LTAKIFLKLLFVVFCVLIVALAALDILVSGRARSDYVEQRTQELIQKARMLALLSPKGFADLPAEKFKALGTEAGVRLTVVTPDGVVLADSEADPVGMENHGSRPEVISALRGHEGASHRLSPTLGVESLYVAIPIPTGALRLAVPLSDIERQVTVLRKEILMSMVLAFIPAMLVAAFFARSVSARLGSIIEYAGRLADGGFRTRLRWAGKDELTQLAIKLDETGAKLENTFDELRREHGELEKLEKIRKDFVINVSHELRTPLASIQGYTETLLNGALYDADNNVRFLDIIRQNAERLANLTRDLLTLSRIELKLQKFQFASYYVDPLIEHCVDSLLPLAEAKNITISIEKAPAGTEVFCDSEAVHQALSNLVDNAIKYTPEGGSIHVAAHVLPLVEGQPEAVEFSVRDTGIGIPKEDLPRLFERFYRVDKARSRALGGTGLGLAIVKHLVRSQGGTVRVESEYGRGATFAFTVPVQDLGLSEEGEVKAGLTVS
jgi:two-component system phosphate regulon sensor histidine kinase PhoR